MPVDTGENKLSLKVRKFISRFSYRSDLNVSVYFMSPD